MACDTLILTYCLIPLLGCQTTRVNEGTSPPVYVPTEQTSVRLNNVAILDDSIANKVAVEASNWRRTTTGNAEVWAQLRNRTDFGLSLECRVSFYDEQRAPLGAPSSWKRLIFSPNETKTYTEFSTQTNVAFYFVEIREGR